MRLFQILFLCVLGQSVFAQNQYALRSEDKGERKSFYFSSVEDALTLAKSGDTLLLPAGNTILNSPLIVSKKLTILGVGHRPVPSIEPTRLVGDVIFTPTANQSYLSGVEITGKLQFGQAVTDKVKDVKVVACRIGDVSLSACNDAGCANSEGLVFQQNIIDANVWGKGANAVFAQNIIGGHIFDVVFQSVFTNNIFLNPAGPVFVNVKGFTKKITVSNNIFLNELVMADGCTDLSFENNLFTSDFQVSGTRNTETRNLKNISAESIFKNASGNTFEYAFDYALQDVCAGKNAGVNGTDIGIFGTNPTAGINTPFNVEMTPFNPVLSYDAVQRYPNAEGRLKADFQVKANQKLTKLIYWFNNASADAKTLTLNESVSLNDLILDVFTVGASEEAKVHFQFTDAKNQFSSVFTSDFVNASKPELKFTCDQTKVCAGKSIHFTNESKFAKDYRWYFGNGKTATEDNPTVVYEQAGTYTVKLVATHIQNGAQDSLISESYITVVNAKTAQLSLQKDTVVCASKANQITVQVVGATPSEAFRWMKDGKNVNQTSESINVKEAGNYQVEMTDENGCTSLSSPVKIDFLALTLNFSGDTIICPDAQKMTLKPLNASFPDGTLFQWYYYNQLLLGENGQEFTPQSPGTYHLTAFHPSGDCRLESSAQIEWNLIQFTEEAQDITFCIDGQKCLTMEKFDAKQKVQWYLNGQAVSGATGKQFCTKEAGQVTVRVTAPNGCINESLPATLHSTPVVRVSNDSIILGGKYPKVQWYVNDIAFPGASTRILMSRINGTYYVKVEDECGTQAKSNVVNFSFTDRMDVSGTQVKMYPNPVQDQMMIEGLDGLTQMNLLNMNGQIVMRQQLVSGSESISLSHLPAGVYMMTLQGEGKYQTTKIIKQ